jgi:type VI secretion system secreted protein VgrG
MPHAITLKSDLGEGLLFVRMKAHELMGRDYRFALEAISMNDAIDMKGLLGKPMSVKVKEPETGYTRYFHGIVSEAAQQGYITVKELVYATYTFTLVPKLWLLQHRQDSRIFKNQTVPQLVRKLLADIGYTDLKLRLSGNYVAREYCVQYRESDFDFISRLMEQEGIYYYFEHSDSKHVMVLSDSLGSHQAVPGFAQLSYSPPIANGKRRKGSIWDWTGARSAQVKQVKLTDYDYLKPKFKLDVQDAPAEPSGGAALGELEVFDYPGRYDKTAVGRDYARVRAEARNVPAETYRGRSDAVGLQVGALFNLKDFTVAAHNREYLVTAAVTELVEVNYTSGMPTEETLPPFITDVDLVPSRTPYRSAQTTPRPLIAGLQTAVVHGDTPEDIQVDRYGRVEVDFFWNPPGKKGALCSCPVRVSTPWAGRRWGAIHIPRVGQEVVVSFLEGDPDRPLIVGSVYNDDLMPPYALPANKTQSGIRSRSHPRGGAEDYNEIRFEDKKGREELLLHAQRDLRHVAEHDEFGETGRDRDHKVQRNDTLDVGRVLKIRAGMRIELVSGASKITLDSTGRIDISGVNIRVDGRANTTVTGAMVVVNATAMLNVMSSGPGVMRANGMLMLQASGLARLQGTPGMVGSPGIVM